MGFKSVLFVFLFSLFTFSIGAQKTDNIDSLLQVYEKLPNDTTKIILIDDIFEYYIDKDTLNPIQFAKEQYALSKKINYQKGVGESYFKYARYYNTIGNYDSTLKYFNKALTLFQDIDFIKGQAKVRYQMATARTEEDYPDDVLEMLDSNIEFYKQINDSVHLANSYFWAAGQHLTKGNYRIALKNNLNALKYFEQKTDPIELAWVYFIMSAIECELKNGEEALKYASKALTIYKKYNENNSSNAIASVYNTMGVVYTYQKDFEKADSILNKAYLMAKALNFPYLQKLALINHSRSYEDRKDYGNVMLKMEEYLKIEKNSPKEIISSLGLLGMGTALTKTNNAKEGKIYLNKALIAARKENVKSRILLTYLHRADANAQLNNFEDAYKDHKMYALWKDSVYNEEKSQQIEEMRAIFDTEKKEQQIVLQENEIVLLEEKEKVSNLQKLLLSSGLGLSVLVFGFGFYGIRQKMKRNKLEKEKVDAELAFKKKELTTHALHLAKKNEVLENVKQKAKELKSLVNGERGYQQLIQTINFDQQDDKNWENFTQYFEQVHKDFSKTVKTQYVDITKNELRFMALLKMNLSSKEIATILNISSDGVKKARQRLRKKMNLSSEDSLETTILSI